MRTARTRLALIHGSAREGRFCDTVMNWLTTEIAGRAAFDINLADPRELDLPLGTARGEHAGVQRLRRLLDEAEGFVVVTPEYNHGYPAALKALVDAAGREWEAKPVGFVSYGGHSGGIRAVEQLRQVFAELHAVTLRDAVVFPGVWNLFDADGRLIDPLGPRQALDTLLDRMLWWSTALSEARRLRPYRGIAGVPAAVG